MELTKHRIIGFEHSYDNVAMRLSGGRGLTYKSLFFRILIGFIGLLLLLNDTFKTSGKIAGIALIIAIYIMLFKKEGDLYFYQKIITAADFFVNRTKIYFKSEFKNNYINVACSDGNLKIKNVENLLNKKKYEKIVDLKLGEKENEVKDKKTKRDKNVKK